MNYVIFDNEKIEYNLTRKNVKNINLRIYPNGKVNVSAPKYVGIDVINAFVLKNAGRIVSAKNKFAEALPVENNIFNCSQIYVFGNLYKLVAQIGEKNACRIENGVLYLTCKDSNIANKVFYNYVFDEAQTVFSEILSKNYYLFSRYCKSVPELKIRMMKSQWGNCRPKLNRITLNLKLVHFDRKVIEFVILHEYCHFAVANHSKDFYNVLNSVMPDWKKYDLILKKQLNYC